MATTRREKAVMQSFYALKTYRRWMRSSLSQYMKRKNELRVKFEDHGSDSLAYLQLKHSETALKRCGFSKSEVCYLVSSIVGFRLCSTVFFRSDLGKKVKLLRVLLMI